MTFTESIKSCIRNTVNFSGRAPRSEYWFFVLFNIMFTWLVLLLFTIVGYSLAGIEGAIVSYYVSAGLCLFLLFLPSLSVMIRRLHDSGHSGWWYFITYVPLIGCIWMLFLLCKASDEENEYGLPVY